MIMQADCLWVNAHLATFATDNDYGVIEHGAIASHAGKIVWLGAQADLPEEFDHLERIDVNGAWITPGLIDCHTHVVYAGNRAHEFEQRLQGKSYADIANAGGGIRATVAETRVASEESLYEESAKRFAAMLAQGVKTVEIKSGYGLDLATEAKQLRVARRLGQTFGVNVITTFLGAHALPAEYAGRSDDYINEVCHIMLPALVEQGLVDMVDVFCESIAFNLAQTEQVFAAAKAHNLPIKCHAEQLSDLGASKLAAQYQARSVDHIEHISDESVKAIAKAGTVAVLLPGAFYYLRDEKCPPIDALRQHQIPMAIATDCNPGSSPTTSLLLMLNMSCVLFGLTPLEALLGVTRHAAKALGLEAEKGSLEVGKDADISIWQIEHPRDLVYTIGADLHLLNTFTNR